MKIAVYEAPKNIANTQTPIIYCKIRPRNESFLDKLSPYLFSFLFESD